MEKTFLDYTMVPLGLLTMVAYHIWLIHRVVNHPGSTVMGLNAITRKIWVEAMMEDIPKNGILAVQTLRNNMMASTLLATTAIMLSSVIGILMTAGAVNHSWFFVPIGDKSPLGFSVKFFAILVCFLIAFFANMQAIRYYNQASVLINVPYQKIFPEEDLRRVTSEYVTSTVNRGSYFWSLGLRAFYFSFPMFLWIFGPIPMFLSCCSLVVLLYFLDFNFEFGSPSVRVSRDHNGT